MRRNILFAGIALLAAALALAAVACDDDGDGDGATATDTPGVEAPTEPPAATEPAATEPAATEPSDEVTAIILEEGGSGVAGSATLSPTNGGTQVEVDIVGGLEPGSHASHIHNGTCDAQGDIDEPLSNVEADDTGAGSASSTIDARPLTDFTDGNHYVAVHDLAGAVVGCGDILG